MAVMSKEKLSEFINKIEYFNSAKHPQKIIIFGYYVTKIANKPYFDQKLIRQCYELLDDSLPVNVTDSLNKLKDNGKLVVANGGYRIAKSEADELDKFLLQSKPTASASHELEKLRKKLVNINNEFVNEALECFRVKAWHAIVVLVWIITIDHLQDYIIKKNLIEFNRVLQQNGYYKNITISKKEDFEDIKDSDLIVVLRTLGWITGGQMKILEGKLNFRNSYAHPSTLILTESMTVSFVEDLMLNVVLKI